MIKMKKEIRLCLENEAFPKGFNSEVTLVLEEGNELVQMFNKGELLGSFSTSDLTQITDSLLQAEREINARTKNEWA